VKITKIKPGKYKIDYRIGGKRKRETYNCDSKAIIKIKKNLEYKIIAHRLGFIEEVKKNPKEQTLAIEFLKEKKQENLRESTLDRYKYSLSLIGSKLKSNLNKFSPSTYNSYVNDLNVFYNWCKDKGYDYKVRFKKKKLDKPLPKFFTSSDLEIIFKNSTGIYRNIYDVLLQTGIRISELYVCNYNDGYVSIPAEFAKSRRDRHIPVISTLEPTLYKVQNNRLHTRTIQKNLKTIINKFDLGARKSCHSFRHTFALFNILNNDVSYVQWLLGHSQIKTTMIYLNYDKDFIKKHLKLDVHRLSTNVDTRDKKTVRGYSSVGRALEWHSRGQKSKNQ